MWCWQMPLVLVLDRCNADGAQRTLAALRALARPMRTDDERARVRGSFLLVVLDAAPHTLPSECAAQPGEAFHAALMDLLAVDFIEVLNPARRTTAVPCAARRGLLRRVAGRQVRLLAFVASDSLLIAPQTMATGSSPQAWRPDWGGAKGYTAVRALHALREVLSRRGQALGPAARDDPRMPGRTRAGAGYTAAVLLEAGAAPAPGALEFWAAARPLLIRGAVIAASALPAAPELVTEPHPCNSAFELSPALAPPSPPGAPPSEPPPLALALDRMAFLQLYSQLRHAEGLSLAGMLAKIAQASAARGGSSARAFLVPAAHLPPPVFVPPPLSHARAVELPAGGAGDDKCAGGPAQCASILGAILDELGREQLGSGASADTPFDAREAREAWKEAQRKGAGSEEMAEKCAAHGWFPRARARAVADVVTYLQEEGLLRLRLEELAGGGAEGGGALVERVVIVEGDRSFRGAPRPGAPHLPGRLATGGLLGPAGAAGGASRFRSLIRHVWVQLPSHADLSRDNCTAGPVDASASGDADAGARAETCGGHAGFRRALAGSWTSGYRDWFKREWLSRHAGVWALGGMAPDDLVLLSDVDEIPRGAYVALLKRCGGIPAAQSITSAWHLYNASFSKRAKFLTPNVITARALAATDGAFSPPSRARRPAAPQANGWEGWEGWVGGGPGGGSLSSKTLRCHGFWHLIPWAEDQGWHLSYFGDVKSFVRKVTCQNQTEICVERALPK